VSKKRSKDNPSLQLLEHVHELKTRSTLILWSFRP